MKRMFVLLGFLWITVSAFAQSGCTRDFKIFDKISKQDSVAPSEFANCVQILKEMEANKCFEYTVTKNGVETVVAVRTFLFGQICLKNNSDEAVGEYVKYLKRNMGSAEEELCFSFERLFIERPGTVLSLIVNSKKLMDQLEWGFVSNHFHDLTTKNCRTIFYSLNPKIKGLYSKYKKQIDYLIDNAAADLKS